VSPYQHQSGKLAEAQGVTVVVCKWLKVVSELSLQPCDVMHMLLMVLTKLML
jgi:hypothetical protein